jgi:hypothetical protein
MRGTRWAVAAIVIAGFTFAGVPSTATTSWDTRVEPIAHAVEDIRGLEFQHRVRVEFLSDSAFRARVRRESGRLSAADRRRLDAESAELRALGLASGDIDLAVASSEYAGENVLAYYDPSRQRITVRGDALTPATEVVLAHELTHALQDQHFDLDKLDRTARTSTQSAVREALVEGDATRIQNLYTQNLTDDERAEAEAVIYTSPDGEEAAEETESALPDVLGAIYEAPYILGPDLVESLAAHGGTRAIDRALRNPPATDEGVFNPLTAVTEHRVKRVASPKLRKGERRAGEPDDFGAFSLYLLLASRLDTLTALEAADGWAGDAETRFTRGGKRCLRVDFAGHQRTDTARIARALREATAALPRGSTEVEDRLDRVELTVCDPGGNALEPQAFAERALRQLALRNTAVASSLGAGVDVEAVSCFADRVVHDELWQRAGESEEEPSEEEANALWSRWGALLASCRATS